MAGASTIVIAREDFSIPDGEPGGMREARRRTDIEGQFFALVRERRPAVIVLDLRKRYVRWHGANPEDPATQRGLYSCDPR